MRISNKLYQHFYAEQDYRKSIPLLLHSKRQHYLKKKNIQFHVYFLKKL